MAQQNGYVCHLCVAQSAEQSGMGQIHKIDMNLCCKILQDCIEDGLLTPGPCPEYQLVTVYFPVLDDDDTEDDFSPEYRDMISTGRFYDK